jgi:hypothetical protein
MIIYCAGPIKGDTTHQIYFKNIIKYVEQLGHSVLSGMSEKFSSTIPLTEKQIYKRDLKWIDGSRVMIAEISSPSLGVGFEIAYGIFERKLPVLAVHYSETDKISAMILGCDSALLTVQKYLNEEDMKTKIKDYLSKINQ